MYSAPNADLEMVDMDMSQPKLAEHYYNKCVYFDQQNHHHQDSLKLEKLETKEWSKRVIMAIFGIFVVDTWLVWIQVTSSICTQNDFYINLSEDLIDNTFDQVGGIGVRLSLVVVHKIIEIPKLIDIATGNPRVGIRVRLVPTKTNKGGGIEH